MLDVTSPEQVAEVHARLNVEQGPIDVLVNNAGVVFGGRFLDVPLDKHMITVGVNLAGVLTMTHAFLPDLLARPAGHVVIIASAAAVLALPMATSYAASKWAVLGFSESLREELRELGHRHVGITAVCPSYVSTGLFDGAQPARMTGWLTPEKVAHATVHAVEKGWEFVMLPWQRERCICSAPVARSWYHAVCRVLGVRGAWSIRRPSTEESRLKPNSSYGFSPLFTSTPSLGRSSNRAFRRRWCRRRSRTSSLDEFAGPREQSPSGRGCTG